MTVLLPSALTAFDADTSPEFIEFQVLPASNGHIALTSDPTRPIFEFTQEDINNGSVVFVHKGKSFLQIHPLLIFAIRIFKISRVTDHSILANDLRETAYYL